MTGIEVSTTTRQAPRSASSCCTHRAQEIAGLGGVPTRAAMMVTGGRGSKAAGRDAVAAMACWSPISIAPPLTAMEQPSASASGNGPKKP